MRSVTYSMGVSLDGYIVGPDGTFDWTGPEEDVFRFWIDEIREVGVHLMGRRLYETMLYWETADENPLARRRRARVGRALESAPEGGVLHHALDGPGQCPPGLRRPGGGDRAVASRAGGGRHRDRRRDARRRGGRVGSDRRVPAHGLPGPRWRWHPVLSAARASADLELVETRTFSSRVVYLRYRVAR